MTDRDIEHFISLGVEFTYHQRRPTVRPYINAKYGDYMGRGYFEDEPGSAHSEALLNLFSMLLQDGKVEND